MEEKDRIKELLTREVLASASALSRFAYSLCQSRQVAEELVAETVVKAFEKRHQIKEEGKIRQWLFRILNNVFISSYRKNKRQGQKEAPETPDASFSLFEHIATSNFTDGGTPEKDFISKITREKIHQAIHQLPEEFRTTLVLCDVEEFSYAEIAAIMHVPVGTVRSRIARARTLLQKRLWMYAGELGITTTAKQKEHVCTCGKEESKTTNTLTT